MVKDFYTMKADEPVEGTFAVSNVFLRTFSGSSTFLALNLQDKTGIIPAVLWEGAEKVSKVIKDGYIVFIKGKISFYHQKNQVNIEKIRIAEDYIIDDLVPSSQFDPNDMWAEFCGIMDEMVDEDLKAIWMSYKNDDEFVSGFIIAPGGKGTHHTYRAGLLEHTLSVLKIVKAYKQIYPVVMKWDMAYMGAFVHDIGKLRAYHQNQITISKTNNGRLHEHSALGYHMFLSRLADVVESIDIEKMKMIIEDIGHIILSHHGKFAPVKPMTAEARLIAELDLIDADLNYFYKFEDKVDDDGWYFDHLNDQFFLIRK